MCLSVTAKISPDKENSHNQCNGNYTNGNQKTKNVHTLGALLHYVSRKNAWQDMGILNVSQACSIEISIFYRNIHIVISSLYVALIEQFVC